VEKAIDTLELAVKTYPLEASFPINLGVAQLTAGQYEDSLASNNKALALLPDDAVARENDLGVLIQLDRMQEAGKSLEEIKRLRLDDSTNLLAVEYPYYFMLGDTTAMATIASKIKGRLDEFRFNTTVATVQEFAGEYQDAGKTWKLAAEQAATHKAPDAQASMLLSHVSGQALIGNCQNAAQTVKEALALDRSKPTLFQAAYTSALCNDRSDALSLLAKLGKEYPEDTIIQQVLIPESRAALALAAHQPADALRELEGAKAFYLVSTEAYFEGLAYLDLHDGTNAIEAFQRATAHKGNSLASGLQDYGPGLLGLARAYTMAGNKAAAKKTYEDLFEVWKKADKNLQPLEDARKEYAALK
jgi:eukaryotic-like serine/threonine-protein kinase